MIFKNVVSPFLVCANRITPRLWKVENSLQTLHILGIGSFIGDILQQIHQLNAIMATDIFGKQEVYHKYVRHFATYQFAEFVSTRTF